AAVVGLEARDATLPLRREAREAEALVAEDREPDRVTLGRPGTHHLGVEIGAEGEAEHASSRGRRFGIAGRPEGYRTPASSLSRRVCQPRRPPISCRPPRHPSLPSEFQ